MSPPLITEKIARPWMVTSDSVSFLTVANVAEDLRNKHNLFVQAVVGKVTDLEQEVKRVTGSPTVGRNDVAPATSNTAESPRKPPRAPEPPTRNGDLSRISRLEMSVEAMKADNDHLRAQLSAELSDRDVTVVTNKLRYLKNENDALKRQQNAMQQQIDQLIGAVMQINRREEQQKKDLAFCQDQLLEAQREITRLKEQSSNRAEHLRRQVLCHTEGLNAAQMAVGMQDKRITWLENSLGKRA